ncbi:MAG: HD-GYP domain-containing protein [Candidatus Binatia bacterium]
MSAPALAEPEDFSAATIASPSRPRAERLSNDLAADLESEARRRYELVEDWIAHRFAEARQGTFDGSEMFSTVQAMVEPRRLFDALFAETFRPRQAVSFLPRSALNVAIYSLRLGRGLGYEGDRLLELGVAGLLHKIGLTKLPATLVQSPERFNRRDLATLREHPKLARDLIRRLGDSFQSVAEIVYQSCERIDGSGYPQKLREPRVSEAALAVGLVSIFDALTQSRPYRQRVIPFAAVKQLLEQEREHFTHSLLREFISAFSMFPPFTYVRLNTKALARVIETDPRHPLRPTVMIVLDGDGRRPVASQTLDLREHPLLSITGPVDDKELLARGS